MDHLYEIEADICGTAGYSGVNSQIYISLTTCLMSGILKCAEEYCGIIKLDKETRTYM